jgi:hypothetical protein
MGNRILKLGKGTNGKITVIVVIVGLAAIVVLAAAALMV